MAASFASSGSNGAPNTATSSPREAVLARFIRLCAAIFATPTPQESAALIVNRISELVRVDRAVLVRLSGKPAIVAVTGGGTSAQDTQFADAVETVRRRYGDRARSVILPRIPPSAKSQEPHLWSVQQAMGGTRVLWMPLWLSSDDAVPPKYALWLERWHGARWEKADIDLLQHGALFMGHALQRSKAVTRSRSRFGGWAAAFLIALFLAMPVTSHVSAPALVVPDRPHHIFAPMDGILKDLHVQPGQWVESEDLLFTYDARVLDKRLDEAYRQVAVARAKLVRLQGAAHRDPDARAEIPVQEIEVGRAEAEARFFEKQRARADVRTGKPGVIVLDDPDALVGAAIQTGEAVMSIADPSRLKLHIRVPSGDVGLLKPGARVSVRLDSLPLQSIPATVTRVGFEVGVSENGVSSVLVEAVWSDGPPEMRPGQKGTAKIFGPSTFMGMQILRKPYIAVRNLIGF